MSRGADIAGSDATADWRAIHDAGDIQFAPLAPAKPTAPPAWLEWLGERLRALLEPLGEVLGLSWPFIENLLIVLAVLLALLVAWRLMGPALERRRQRRPAEMPEWTPDRAAAVALLEDADRLAAQGRLGEAAHLLLRRSVHHIAEARPDWLRPATTAREIAALPMLPDRAKAAFAEIAVRVERSLFARRDLDARDWQAARAAYAEFALQRLDEARAPA